MDLNYYDSPKDCAVQGIGSRPTLKQRLERQKAEHEESLTRINAALAALNEHPEVMKVLELVSQV